MKKTLIIADVSTGERLGIEKATPVQISEFLTDISFKLKELKKLDTSIKKYIKDKREVEFEENENGVLEARFGNHKLIKSYRSAFDRRKFSDKATDEEKGVLDEAEKVKKGYLKLTEVVTFK